MRIGITGGRGTLGKILQAQLATEGLAYDCFAGDVCRPEELRAWLQAHPFDEAAAAKLREVESALAAGGNASDARGAT